MGGTHRNQPGKGRGWEGYCRQRGSSEILEEVRALGGLAELQPFLVRPAPKTRLGRASCQAEEFGLHLEGFRKEQKFLQLGSDAVKLRFRRSFRSSCGEEMRGSLGEGESGVSETI